MVLEIDETVRQKVKEYKFLILQCNQLIASEVGARYADDLSLPPHLLRLKRMKAAELSLIAQRLGFSSLEDLIEHVDFLHVQAAPRKE